MKIELSNDDRVMVSEFAEKVYPTNKKYLEERNQNIEGVIKDQIIVGKLGELAVREWILQGKIKSEVSQVDFNVTDKKSFEADLTMVTTIRVHVKTQSMRAAENYGLSWTFGYGKEGDRDREIFDSPQYNDRVVFCLVDNTYYSVQIKAVVPVPALHELNMFEYPRKLELRHVKRVVYFSRIPQNYWVK